MLARRLQGPLARRLQGKASSWFVVWLAAVLLAAVCAGVGRLGLRRAARAAGQQGCGVLVAAGWQRFVRVAGQCCGTGLQRLKVTDSV